MHQQHSTYIHTGGTQLRLLLLVVLTLFVHTPTASTLIGGTNDTNRIPFKDYRWGELRGQSVALVGDHIFVAAPGTLLPGLVEFLRRKGAAIIDARAKVMRDLHLEGQGLPSDDLSNADQFSQSAPSLEYLPHTSNHQLEDQQDVFHMIQSKPRYISIQINHTRTDPIDEQRRKQQLINVPPSDVIQQYEFIQEIRGTEGKRIDSYGVSMASMGDMIAIGSPKSRSPIQTGAVFVIFYLSNMLCDGILMTCSALIKSAGADIGCLVAYAKPYIVSVACGTNSIVVFRYIDTKAYSCFHYQPPWAPKAIDAVAACNGYFAFTSVSSKVFEVFSNVGVDSWRKHGMVQAPPLLDPMLGGEVSHFGSAIAMDEDIIVVGASATASAVGCVVFYSTKTLEFLRIMWPPVNIPSGRFGARLVMSGNYLAVSATGCHSTTRQCIVGAVHLYRKDGEFLQTFRPVDGMAGDMYGVGISLTHNQICVGSTRQYATNYGAAYLYQANGTSWDDSYIPSPLPTMLPSPSQSTSNTDEATPQPSFTHSDAPEGNGAEDDTTIIIISCAGGAAVFSIGVVLHRRKHRLSRHAEVLPYAEKGARADSSPASSQPQIPS